MEFSDLYKQMNSHVSFSPDGQYVAVSVQHRLIIRDTENPKKIVQVYATNYETSPYIEEIEWSADSCFILTASYTENKADVWSLEDERWRCSIVDEVSKIKKAIWAPDSRHVLTYSELELRLTIWSLLGSGNGNGGVKKMFIQYPKPFPCIDFSPNNEYVAIGQRHDYKDHIAVYSIVDEPWSLVKEFGVDTMDMKGIKWSPDGLHLCAWDTPSCFAAFVYNAIGVVKKRIEFDDSFLGVCTCTWSPTGQILALGSYDRKLRLFNNLTWQCIATLQHKPQIMGSVDAFVEERLESGVQGAKALVENQRIHTRFELIATPTSIKTVIPVNIHQPNPKVGVKFAQFYVEGTLLATIDDSMPNTIWIWRTQTTKLVSVIQTLNPIRACHWSPLEPCLMFVTGNSTVYMWKEDEGCHIFEIPAPTMTALSFVWNPNADSMAILSKTLFCLGYLTK